MLTYKQTEELFLKFLKRNENMKAKFKVGDWVYKYDKYGVITKNLVRQVIGNEYILTGNPYHLWGEHEIFKLKRECIADMKANGIEECKSLLDATIARQHDKIKLLDKALKFACESLADFGEYTSDEIYDALIEIAEEEK